MADQQQKKRSVLITGCSTGIGRATAARLNRAGWTVYATARRSETLGELAAAGCRTLPLDVVDESSRQEAVRRIEAECGVVDVLVNNAGYGQIGAVETLTLERLRQQFETNVFGAIRLTQLVLPGMRRQGWGKIVNISSIAAKMVYPGAGAYHASKSALEALSDAMRFELRPFGVDVILIEPGLIQTHFAETVTTNMEPDTGPYAAFNAAIAQATKNMYANRLFNALGGEPDTVAVVVEKALNSRRPRTRYAVTLSATLQLLLRRMVTDRLWEAVVSTQLPKY